MMVNTNSSGGIRPGKLFRDVYSTVLLIFCSVIVIALMFTEHTKVAKDFHPVGAFFILWIALYWLSMVEGGQASLVGLPPVDMDLYKDSHPTSHKIMTIINRGDNLDRYLMGRQFLVLALVFVEHICAAPTSTDIDVLGLPRWVNTLFLETGLAVFFMTAMIAKISAQVNASRCMLDYVNNWFAYFTLQVSRLIEASGLLHCCYVVQTLFAWAAGEPVVSTEAPRTPVQSFFYWAKVLMSAAILAFSFAVTLSALFHGQTTMWPGVPPGVSVVLFFVFMAIVGMLEGMQIAFFAVAKMTEEERAAHPWAKKTCDMCVTLCFFIVARVTTIHLKEGDENIFGVSDGAQAFFDTGLLGALITTIVASITWQLVASAFPMAFLSTPITFFLMKFCLFLEWTGLCQGAWVVALIHRKIVKFKRDEVYIGTAEERSAKAAAKAIPGTKSKDEKDMMEVKPGHMYPGVPRLPANFQYRMHTLDEIYELELELKEHRDEVDNRLKELEAEKKKLMANTPEPSDVEEHA